jgi:hypothetical protein
MRTSSSTSRVWDQGSYFASVSVDGIWGWNESRTHHTTTICTIDSFVHECIPSFNLRLTIVDKRKTPMRDCPTVTKIGIMRENGNCGGWGQELMRKGNRDANDERESRRDE